MEKYLGVSVWPNWLSPVHSSLPEGRDWVWEVEGVAGVSG